MSIVVSHFQTAPLLKAWRAGQETAETSPDLGLSIVTVRLALDGVFFPSGELLTWGQVERINEAKNNCFLLGAEGMKKIFDFSEETGLLYALYPTRGAPTMLVSGIPMHRIKGTEPYADTRAKIKTIAPLTGAVLDTATGLGYTAIAAAATAARVVTIELDAAAVEVARMNPWSRALFEHPRIERILGDSFEEISGFENDSFSRIIHDPPMFNLAGDLYSAEFYAQLCRVLKRGGKLFHYVGALESKSGRNVVKGVVRRLEEVGFKRVERRPAAFGVVASK